MSHPNYGYGGPPQGPYQQQQPGYYPPQQPGGYPPQGPPQGPPQQYPGPGQHQYQQQPYPGAPQPHQNQQWSEHPPPQPYPRQGGGYPPQNQPLQGQYPPQGQYPLQQHSQYPPQQQGQYPPPGNYPPQTQGAYPPPQPMPIPPSLGYDPHQRAPGNATREAEALRKAMKGWGTDEKALINILTKPDPLQMALIRHTYTDHIGRNLEKDLKSELSGNLEDVLLALARGPLDQDVVYAHDAMSGLGTNEKALNDVLLGRSNADLRAIKYAYVAKYEKALVDDIKSDLSGKTEQFFVMLLNATRPEPGAYVDPQSVDADVREIHQATKARSGTDETGVSAVFLGASDAKLVAIAQAFETRYHTRLEAVIKDEFSGHLREAFLSMLAKARDPVGHDADTILECLPVGGGADLKRLIYWVVHLHWNPPHFAAVKGRLRQKLGHDIGAQWRGAISSGDFHEAMRQLWNGV